MLHYIRETGNMVASSFSCNAHLANVYERTVPFWSKQWSYGGVRSLVSYKEHGRVGKGYPRWKSKIDGTPQSNWSEKVFVSVIEKD